MLTVSTSVEFLLIFSLLASVISECLTAHCHVNIDLLCCQHGFFSTFNAYQYKVFLNRTEQSANYDTNWVFQPLNWQLIKKKCSNPLYALFKSFDCQRWRWPVVWLSSGSHCLISWQRGLTTRYLHITSYRHGWQPTTNTIISQNSLTRKNCWKTK